jgi:hypothetical protein
MTSTRQWRGFFFFAFPLVAMIGLSPAAAATYDYTGKDFTTYVSPYTSSDSVSGYVTFATPLPPSISTLTPFAPTDFSFSDGIQTLNHSDSFAVSSFNFTTDGSGNIIGWSIGLEESTTLDQIATCFDGCQGATPIFDNGIEYAIGSAVNFDMPGVWSPQTSQTPLPSALPLLFTGLGFLGLLGWRTKRKNAPVIAAA